MNISKIDKTLIQLNDKPFNINSDISFYSLKLKNSKLTLNDLFSSYFGIQQNDYGSNINLIGTNDFYHKLKELEEYIITLLSNNLIKNKTFKSLINDKGNYDATLNFKIIKDTIFDKNNKFEKIKEKSINTVFQISGIYINNNKNVYGLSVKLISLQ